MSADSGGPGPPEIQHNTDESNSSYYTNNTTSNLTNINYVSGNINMEMDTNTVSGDTIINSVNENQNCIARGNKRLNDDTLDTAKSKICVIEKKNTNNKTNQATFTQNIDYIKMATNNRYRSADKGPFVVNVDGNKGNLGKVHRMSFGKWLFNSASAFKNDITDISIAGQNRIKIITKNARAANELLSLDMFKQREMTAYIPNFRVYSSGVIRDVDLDLDEKEILAEMVSPIRPISVRRLTRKGVSGGSNVNIPVCIVTFDSQNLPEYVSIYGARCRVDRYNPPIRQCQNCFRFKHAENQCRSHTRCEHCGGNHHVNDCTVVDAILPLCVNCNGEHKSTYRECPMRVKLNESNKNLSFSAVTKNRFEVLNLEEDFPEINETIPFSIRKPKQNKIRLVATNKQTAEKTNPSKTKSISKPKPSNNGNVADRAVVNEAGDRENISRYGTDIQTTSSTDTQSKNKTTRNVNPLPVVADSNKNDIHHLLKLINQISNSTNPDISAAIFKYLNKKLEELLNQNKIGSMKQGSDHNFSTINSCDNNS